MLIYRNVKNTRLTFQYYINGAYNTLVRIKKCIKKKSMQKVYLLSFNHLPQKPKHIYGHIQLHLYPQLYASTHMMPHKDADRGSFFWLVAKLPYPTVCYKSVVCTLPLSLSAVAPLSPLSTPINSNVMSLNEITYMCHFSSTIFII